MRTFSPRSLLSVAVWSLLVTITAFTFSGCGIFGGDGGDGNPIAADAVSVRSITGRILAPVDAPQNVVSGNLRAATAGRAGIRVAIEEIPTIFDDTDENGTYVLENVPPGTWHVVAWLEPATGKPYRVRSVTITADTSSSVPITVADLELVITSRVVNGKLVNSAGAVLPFGTKMWLWGKEFTLQTGGLFTTPFLPETATQAEILVATTTTTRAFRFVAPFVSGDAPATILIVVPGLDSSANQAPIVALEAKVGAEVTTKVSQGGTVNLKAAATDAETPNANNLTVSWVVTKGTLTVSNTDKYSATWVAPDKDGIATITVRVNDGQATGSVSLPILVNITAPSQVADQIPPVVNSIVPADKATAIATNTKIVLTFNEPIDPGTLTAEDLLVFPGTGLDLFSNIRSDIRPLVSDFVTGTIAFSNENKTVTFTPQDPLAHGTDYTVSLFAGVQDIEGNPIAEDQYWTFTTVEAPAVTTVSPVNASVNQATSSKITVTFNKAMNTGTFAIAVKDNDNATINGTIAANGDTGFTFTPNPALVFGKTFYVTIPKTVADTLGNSLLENYAFSFSTGNPPTASFAVVDSATKVSIATPLVLTFSQAMDQATLETGVGKSINLLDMNNGSAIVPGTLSFGTSINGGTTVTFTPNAALSFSRSYRIVVTTAAKNSIGEAIQAQFQSTFTTQGPPPTISSSVPSTGATLVLTNSTVKVEFNKALDESTLDTTNVTFTAGGSPVSGTWTYDDSSGFWAVFNPDGNLPNSATCVITVTTGLKASDGGQFASNQTISFTTAAKFTPPPQGEGTTAGNSVSAVDPINQHVYVAGYTLEGSIGKAYVLRYGLDGGDPVVIKPTSTGDTRATGIVVDSVNSAIYICGYTNGTFGGESNKGRIDAFVAKYSFASFNAPVNPNPDWAKQIGSLGNDKANSITVDSSNGFVYITGSTLKGPAMPLNDGSQDLVAEPTGNGDAFPCFLVKLDVNTGAIPNAASPYGLTLIGASPDIHIGEAVVYDSINSSLYIVGTTYGFAPTGGSTSGGTDIFVARVDGNMALGPIVQFGGTGSDRATSVAFDGTAFLYVGGYTNGSISTFGHNAPAGQNDMFVAQLSAPALAYSSAQILKSSGDDICHGIAATLGGDVYMTGYTTGTLGSTSSGAKDVVLVKYTSGLGAAGWATPIQVGTDKNDVSTSMSVYSSPTPNTIYMTGWSEGGIDGTTNTSGDSKVFLLKYDDTGFKY